MSIVMVGATSGSITLQEPAVAGTTVLTLPATSGTILTTASSGQSIPKAALPTGSVLQVVSSVKTDSYFTSSGGAGTWQDIPGQGGSGTWSVTITPTSSTSRILLLAMLTFRNDYWGAALRFVRNSTAIALGDSVANTFQGTTGQFWVSGNNNMTLPAHMSFFDSPATASAVVYKVQFQGNSNGSYIGRTPNQISSTDNGVYPSSIIAMEVAA